MDIEVARHMVRVAFRASQELQTLLPLLKEACSEDEYKDYARGIAGAIYQVGVALTDKAVAAFPELEDEIGGRVEKYGRYL